MDLPLLGRGRTADVYDLGDGRVLRRYREPRPSLVQREVTAMRALRAAGAPVPQVFEATDTDIVMEKVRGRAMLDELKVRPWRAGRMGRQIGEVHLAVLQVDAGTLDLPVAADGSTVLHLDYHPGNVMVDGAAATVIDWTNAGIGPAGLDVAMTWMLMATSDVDDVPRLLRPFVRRLRRRVVGEYLAATRAIDPLPYIPLACRRRIEDPETRPEEKERVRVFEADATGGATEGPGPSAPG